MDTATDTNDTARVYTYRHPDCDFVDVVIGVDTGALQTAWVVTATAGAGTTITATAGYLLESQSTIRLRCPWDANDSGDQVVTVTWEHVTIRRMYMWDVPRQILSTGDNGIRFADSTYGRIGLGAEWYIAESNEAGPKAMIQELRDAWAYYQPQIFSWWTPTSAPFTSTADAAGGKGSASDIFDGATFKHRCRQKRSTDTTQTTRWWVRAYCGSSTTYSLKVTTTSGGSTTVTGKTNTSAAWIDIVDVDMSSDADDTFYIEAWRTAGSGTISVEAVSGIEDA